MSAISLYVEDGSIRESLAHFESDYLHDGMVARLWVGNGYGLSLASHAFSYSGLSTVELAVIRQTGDVTDDRIPFDLDYSTPVTDSVLGYVGPSEVFQALETLRQLPPVYPV